MGMAKAIDPPPRTFGGGLFRKGQGAGRAHDSSVTATASRESAKTTVVERPGEGLSSRRSESWVPLARDRPHRFDLIPAAIRRPRRGCMPLRDRPTDSGMVAQ